MEPANLIDEGNLQQNFYKISYSHTSDLLKAKICFTETTLGHLRDLSIIKIRCAYNYHGPWATALSQKFLTSYKIVKNN